VTQTDPKDAPPHSLPLLVYLPEFGWRRGFYTRPYADKGWCPWEAVGFTKFDSETITHWMPLPASPTPDKETQR